MPYVETGASRLYYEIHGEGPPVLFAHGVGGNHASWYRQIPVLAKHCRMITIDFRAFGNSTDAEGLGRSAYLDDMTAVLDALGIERLVLVGQSMGGGAVAAYTCRHPERVRALIHCDSLAGAKLDEPLGSALKAHSESIFDLPQAERVLGPTTLATDPESAALYLQLASFNSVNLKTVKGTPTPWSPAELSATGVPVLFVVGEEDVLFPPAMIRAVQEQVAGSQYVEIPKAGHSAYFEQAEPFNRAVIDFLTGLPA